MAGLEIGMSKHSFFQNYMEELKKLPKEQKQKIANFWTEDFDNRITNEIELAMLKGFTSKSGLVVMPQGDPTLFERRNDAFGIDVFASGDKNNKYSKFCTRICTSGRQEAWTSSDRNTIKYDSLIDEDGDGIADYREIRMDWTFLNHKGGCSGDLSWTDSNLDGHFDKKYNPFNKEQWTKEYIDEMMSDNNE